MQVACICLSVGKNVVHQLGVTLEEMYKGATRKLGLQKNVICEKCDGMLYCNDVLILISQLKKDVPKFSK